MYFVYFCLVWNRRVSKVTGLERGETIKRDGPTDKERGVGGVRGRGGKGENERRRRERDEERRRNCRRQQ